MKTKADLCVRLNNVGYAMLGSLLVVLCLERSNDVVVVRTQV